MAGVSARLRSTAALPRRIGKQRSVECRPPTALRHSTAEPGSMAHPQVIAERHSTWGPPPRTAVARMAAARLAARWEVARMAAVVHMAAGHPTLRWGHPMAAVRPMAVAGPMAVAARMAEGQPATTAEATSALSYLGRLSSRRRRCAERKQASRLNVGAALGANVPAWCGRRRVCRRQASREPFPITPTALTSAGRGSPG